MTQPCACHPKVMRREPFNARFAGVLAHHVPDRFLRQTVTPGTPVLVYPPEQFAGTKVGRLKPLIDRSLDPAGHRHCPGVAGRDPAEVRGFRCANSPAVDPRRAGQLMAPFKPHRAVWRDIRRYC